MTAAQILNGLEADGILKVVSMSWATGDGLFELKDGFVRLVELRGFAALFNPFVGSLQRQLDAIKDKAWDVEGGWEGHDHELSDSIGAVIFEIGRHFHPISISQRAMRERRAAVTS